MKKNYLYFKLSAFILLAFNLSANVPEGSFTSLHVKAKDVKAYVEYIYST